MTETCACTSARLSDVTEAQKASVGRPCKEIKVRIIDDKGNKLDPGHPGEILVHGPTNMQKYYNDPEKTSLAIRNGWLHTGDIGQLDEDGFLYILERKNDMIKTGGENIYPKEVENVLYQHPEVREAAVFGLPDKTWGQKICAAVVLKEGARTTEANIIAFCKTKLASFKKPKQVFFLDTLVRTASGKIKRSDLRDRYSNGS